MDAGSNFELSSPGSGGSGVARIVPDRNQVSAYDAPKFRLSAGGLLLWAGTVAIGVSTVIVLAVLSRHLHRSGFTNVSTLFGLFFVASLIPSGIPLRAAALVVDGAPRMRVSGAMYVLMSVGGALFAPIIAVLLHLPVVAVALVAAQVIVAIPLSIKRGSLIAAHRFDAMGGNFLVEAGSRVLAGTLGGLYWGMNGVAGGLAVATVLALVAIPNVELSTKRVERQMTTMLHTWLALVLLGLLVQLDILIAPTALARSAATRYDLAALPSKGVYLVLLAVSTLIFPYVRVHASRKTVFIASALTLCVGLVVTGVLVLARGPIGSLLGQEVASLPLLLTLGAAMSLAGATGILINAGIALGIGKPWPPLVLGIGCLFTASLLNPTVAAFGYAVLGAQILTFLLSLVVCLRQPSSGS